MKKRIKELLAFLEASPSCFHAVEAMRTELEEAGYQQLLESEDWDLEEDGRYYVIRNGSSLIAFRIPRADFVGFQIMASHSDSPTFKIKENPEVAAGPYVKLNTERYGGMMMGPWFDRPLSIAGRVLCRESGGIRTHLVDVDRDLLVIPSLAIHLDAEANSGKKWNAQKDMLPLYGMGFEPGTLKAQIAEAADVDAESILGMDLYLYNRQPGTIWGAKEEFVSAGRLDDLECAFASLQGFLAASDSISVPVHCVFDNEEVGNSTKQGAASTFLRDTLERICECFDRSGSGYRKALASSFMLSADNAHALHPNYMEQSCPTNRPVLNGGIVLKYNASQRYTTDAVSAAVLQELCERTGVPVQTYANRSDLPGGSTLGNVSGNQVAVNCVDIGLPQLAMHSPYETAGVKDLGYLLRVAKAFYESAVVECEYGCYQIK